MDVNVWYLDDGTLIGDAHSLNRALHLLLDDGPSLGLYLNMGKCEIWSPAGSSLESFPPNIIRVTGGGTDLLGSALGDSVTAERVVTKRVMKIEQMVLLLSEVQDAEIEFKLLKSCIGVPKFNFALRSRNLIDIPESTCKFDAVIREGVQNILGNCVLTDIDFLRISLPVSKSGLGIPLAGNVAPAAYLGSKVQTLLLQKRILRKANLCDIVDSMEESCRSLFDDVLTNTISDNSLVLTFDKLLTKKDPQHTVSLILDDWRMRNKLLGSIGNGRAKAVALVGCGDNGQFLNVVPIEGSQLSSIEFRIACKLYLGIAVFSHTEPIACPCCKVASMDVYGDHAVVCSTKSDCSTRHNAVRDRLARAASDGQFSVSVEKKDVLDDGTQSKPADIFITFWRDGKAVAIDVTGASSIDFAEDVTEPLNKAANRKNDKFLRRCSESGVLFMPFVFGSLGNFDHNAVQIMTRIGVAQSRVRGCAKGDCISWLKGAVSVDIMKAQANAIIRRGEAAGVLVY